jgi:energy-coupling factor transporter ATP-binding protein EcfA2
VANLSQLSLLTYSRLIARSPAGKGLSLKRDKSAQLRGRLPTEIDSLSAEVYIPSVIEVRNLLFSYRDERGSTIPAIRGLDLSIPEGSYLAVLGPNGSGKSTLARLLAGIIPADSGELRLGGLDPKIPKQREKLRATVGLIFQNPDNQLVSVTVERELAFGLENLGLPPEEMKDRIDWALEKFNLGRYRFHSPNKLSGGEKQRLAIAAVVAMRPSYLILDEPTSFLDPAGRAEILSILNGVNSRPDLDGPARTLNETADPERTRRVTTMHITQFPEEACRAERVVVLSEGKVFMEGTPQDVFSQADLLRSIGLCLPQLGQLQRLLRERGVEIGGDLCRAEEFHRSLVSLREKRDPRTATIPLPQPEAGRRPSKLRRDDRGSEIVTLENVSFRYRDFASRPEAALSEVNLSICVGEFMGLVGPTGSGKTTLANLVAGLLEPTSGRLWPRRRKEGKVEVGLILQFPERQFFRERVLEDITYGLENLGCNGGEAKREALRALQLVNLEAAEFCDRHLHTLSGGEKRCVAIASILALRPRLLVLDEPFLALDPGTTARLMETLRQIHEAGTSVLLISHDLAAIFELVDRLVVLKEGRIAVDLPSGKRELWPEAVLESGLPLPEHLALLKRLEGEGWKVSYNDLTLGATALKIAESLVCRELPAAFSGDANERANLAG